MMSADLAAWNFFFSGRKVTTSLGCSTCVVWVGLNRISRPHSLKLHQGEDQCGLYKILQHMSHPIDVWRPGLTSAVTPSGGNPRGPSPDGRSLPTSLSQIEAPLALPPHKISPQFSYPLPPSPKLHQFYPLYPGMP